MPPYYGTLVRRGRGYGRSRPACARHGKGEPLPSEVAGVWWRPVDYGILRWWDSQHLARWEERTTFPAEGPPQVGGDERIA
jgi:hypothetical protein